jgi:hypothetical protein
MSFFLTCSVGAAVLAALPSSQSPTLRQAIVAANVPALAAHVSNLDTRITGWFSVQDDKISAIGVADGL